MTFYNRHRAASLGMVQRVETISAHLTMGLARERLWA